MTEKLTILNLTSKGIVQLSLAANKNGADQTAPE